MIAVDTVLPRAPRTDPDVPNLGIRLLPWVFGGEPLVWPGMKDPWFRKVVIGQLRHAIPQRAILLASSSEC